jgi:hypothetical protein
MAVPKTAITAPVPTASHAYFLRLGGIASFNVLACSCCEEFTGAPLDWHDEKIDGSGGKEPPAAASDAFDDRHHH